MGLRIGFVVGFVALVSSSATWAQDLTEAQMRAGVDAAIRSRAVVLNNRQDVLDPLYLRPSTAPAPAQAQVAPAAAAPGAAFDVRINFEFDSDDLAISAYPELNRMADTFAAPQYEGLTFLIVGHTDAIGSAAYNQALSVRRATNVVDYLVAMGVPEDRLIPVGRGMSEPLDPDHPESDVNRRVEVEVLQPAQAN
jgi:outer membrane protein OmpA-like peptidoglycan-associated protein